MTKRVFLIVAVLLASATPLASQTIHGHPQKDAYASPAEWPFISAQCHWKPADLTLPGQPGGMLGHTHVEGGLPVWGVENTAFTVPFQIQLFMVTGRVFRIEGAFVRRIVWDATGSEMPPTLIGDPMGLKVFTGHVTFDPSLPDSVGNPVPAKGWYTPGLTVVTAFDNGTFTKAELIFPVYSERDPNAMETPANFVLGSRCTGFPVDVFGTNTAEFRNVMIPILAPIATASSRTVLSYGYGSQFALPLGTFQQILDLNLHAGIPGTVLTSEQTFGGNPNGNPVVFDPAIGVGTHKMAFTWDQPTGAGSAGVPADEEVTALLVVSVTVGDGSTPPPPPPPPPPVLTWQPNTLQPERNGDLERLCAADGKCVVIGTLTTP